MALDPRLSVNIPATVKTALEDAIIEALKEAPFATDQAPLIDPPAGLDPNLKLFEFVDRGVLDDIEMQQVPAARIEQGDEEQIDLMWPLVDKRFRLYVHFKVSRSVGVDPTPLINYYFGRVVNVLVTAEHFAGIALDISEAGNSPQVQGVNDPEPGGTIFFDVTIRHGYGNHFSENGNNE
jgi:hypothetical protein